MKASIKSNLKKVKVLSDEEIEALALDEPSCACFRAFEIRNRYANLPEHLRRYCRAIK